MVRRCIFLLALFLFLLIGIKLVTTCFGVLKHHLITPQTNQNGLIVNDDGEYEYPDSLQDRLNFYHAISRTYNDKDTQKIVCYHFGLSESDYEQLVYLYELLVRQTGTHFLK